MSNDFAFECLGLIGRSLSVPEKVAITCSLKVLSQNEGKKVRFWGKVTGYASDYLVAQTTPATLLEPVDNFYSVDGGTNWVKLDAANEDQKEFCEQLRGPFMGQPGYQYKLQKDIPPEEPEAEAEVAAPQMPEGDEEENEEVAEEDENEEKEEATDDVAAEDGEEEEKKPQKKRPKFQILSMSESSRLAHFIQEHDTACKLTVRGAYLQNPDGSIIKNRTFIGLDVPSASELQNFLKLKIQSNVTANRDLYTHNYNLSTDFLTPITEDRPVGMWVNKYDATSGIAAVENLYFPGSLFAHRVDTAQTGQVYYGNGQRNLDLCFMLP